MLINHPSDSLNQRPKAQPPISDKNFRFGDRISRQTRCALALVTLAFIGSRGKPRAHRGARCGGSPRAGLGFVFFGLFTSLFERIWPFAMAFAPSGQHLKIHIIGLRLHRPTVKFGSAVEQRLAFGEQVDLIRVGAQIYNLAAQIGMDAG